ncbi:hypothetical protein LOD99_1948 [Oopsacas minuta]|uniref:Integrase catalytic domain-containing protein n=1 Tax=Oopsacas minuta TaxID=111878 RepID=A0AAV7K3R3_9METZ|nr:hypothetical protein LOD99_1948 [Oopsacas minuta]
MFSYIDGIRNKYDWNGIYNDVGSYIRTCHDCQTAAALLPQPQRELQPIPPPEEPWRHCGIDLVCNMSRTVLGFQHILVIVCYLSKFEIYLSFGVPNILQHDQGTEFSSKEFQEFHKINVNTRRTTAYHPQSNGLVESHNKILKTSEFVEGDEVLVHNLKKAKRLPGTKDAKKYLGPYTIEKVKPSHLDARKHPDSKTTKLPIHLSRKYHSRMNEKRQVRTKTGKSKKSKRSCKFPSSDSLDDILNLDTMEETFETPQQHSIYENIDSELLQLKPRILSALVNNTYLTQLHEKLAPTLHT